MARFDECLSNAPRAEGKSSSAIRSRSASLLDCNMRQPSFAPAPSDQQEEKKQRASQEISGDVNIRTTKIKLPVSTRIRYHRRIRKCALSLSAV